MFYFYLRFISYVFTVFGIRKPFPSPTGKPFWRWHKIWSMIIVACMIANYTFTIKSSFTICLKKNLGLIYETNDMVINIWIVILNFINGQNTSIRLYEEMQKIMCDCKILQLNMKMIAAKIYLGFIVSSIIMTVFIILEILKTNSFVLIISMPTYLSTFHLVLHLFLLSAILKLVQQKMSSMLNLDNIHQHDNFIDESETKLSKMKYLVNPETGFFKINNVDNFDIKFLCRVYDDLSTCIQLLEQHHGVQMLLTFWLMFTNSVFGITMIVSNDVDYPVLIAARCIIPFLWCFFGSFINDQIRKVVDQIDIIIVKCLIDFRCDTTRRIILQTFKQLVNTNRLQFTACSLFHLNYSMILGTIVNVITYSIILIQLFLSAAK